MRLKNWLKTALHNAWRQNTTTKWWKNYNSYPPTCSDAPLAVCGEFSGRGNFSREKCSQRISGGEIYRVEMSAGFNGDFSWLFFTGRCWDYPGNCLGWVSGSPCIGLYSFYVSRLRRFVPPCRDLFTPPRGVYTPLWYEHTHPRSYP